MDIEVVAMTLVGHAGESKSLSFQALKEAKNNNYEKAKEYLKQSEEEMLKAHEMQTELISKEVSGEGVKISLLMVHAQDHLMNAILVKDLIEEMIEIYKKIN